ncbi:MAG: aldehyde dehydrogenase (NADP(+)) [Alphaproteobacteria bacterium HGW-Alphaproteobacteria-2]|nr:MAG: aldehyde dehydrogenase (NADP(+)) [Alphaproteobacteria bacterium HGW-Alphaproteobacteria-2]
MGFEPSGEHLIAGEWVGGAPHFASSPATGGPHSYSVGTPDHVARAAEAAESAFGSYGSSSRATRAAFLRAIADEIEARGSAITKVGCAETGLTEARLEGERGRTVGQLRLFADHILKGDYLDRRHDPAQPDRRPQPRPDLRLVQRPIGPVAVFGASNFPLAFSVAGGDTASALAAGCPVIVKGHSAHPGTCEIVARAIDAAREDLGLPKGVFSLIQGGRREVGQALVQHPLIRAVGFTGSLAGGRALFDLCAQRPDPIPFFGELGSVNPMFILPGALASRGAEIAQGWAGSLTLGAGQFCTNPGIAVMVEGEDAEAFASATQKALAAIPAQTMLTDGIAAAFRQGRDAMAGKSQVTPILASDCAGRSAAPALLRTTGSVWRADHVLGEEVFGPLGLIVTVASLEEMLALAVDLRGQLTCTLHLDDQDTAVAQRLMPVLERKAGRILANGYPTGVEVCDAMVHGGPYPASTNFGATSVGTMAIRRFLRPVSYQNVPEALLPDDLK